MTGPPTISPISLRTGPLMAFPTKAAASAAAMLTEIIVYTIHIPVSSILRKRLNSNSERSLLDENQGNEILARQSSWSGFTLILRTHLERSILVVEVCHAKRKVFAESIAAGQPETSLTLRSARVYGYTVVKYALLAA
jgi:hypothetical protein